MSDRHRPPVTPAHPERVCWGCEEHCPADHLGCANGTVRTMHPAELFGDDWLEWSERRSGAPAAVSPAPALRAPRD